MPSRKCLILGDEFTPSRLFRDTLCERMGKDVPPLRFSCCDTTNSESTAVRSDEISEAFGDVEDITLRIADCEILITTFAPVTAAILARAPSLIAICCGRGGPVNINLNAATERGVPVLYAPGRNEQAVAEFALAGMINLMRRIPQALDYVRDGQWTTPLEDTFEKPSGPELCGRTLGLVGAGRIGCRVGRLARAFGARVLASDPFAEVAGVEPFGIELVSLEQLLAEADVISIHARLDRDARPLLGAEEFSRMAKRPYLVNTARAATIDHEALLAALEDGQVTAAHLDVHPDEPLSPGSPLLAMDKDRLHLTPHAAGVSYDIPTNTARLLADGLARLLRGEVPDHVVNPQTLQTCFRRLGLEPARGSGAVDT